MRKRKGKNHDLRLMQINIQGVQKDDKYAIFEDYVHQLGNKKPHVIAMNEHWLCPFEVKHFDIKGYKTVAHFGRKNGRGGTLIMTRLNSQFSCKKIKTKSIPKQFETSGCELKVDGVTIRLLNVYRPSNKESNAAMGNFFERIENLIVENLAPNKEMILLGDLNVNLLEENRNDEGNRLMSIFQGYGMALMNENLPTRELNGSRTLIDHIFSSLDCKTEFTVKDVVFSDHKAVHCALKVKVEEPRDTFAWTRLYSEENWESFQNKMRKESWKEVYETKPTDEKSKVLMNKLCKMFEDSFPKQRSTKRATKLTKQTSQKQQEEEKTNFDRWGRG
jgi:endonuclease/exonuclease/phosphatase family metal-dependent hydrolase